MANAIVGTMALLAMAAVVGVPIGVLGGIYLAEYGSDRANDWLRFAADVLNGVPSIVWGMVVWLVRRAPFKTFSAYAGGVALGLMMVPLVMRTTEEVLILVPQSYREAALALGVARWKVIMVIVVRTALKGIATGVIVALARIAGETAPLLFTAFGNNFWNHNLKEPIAALPLQIFTYAISPYDDWHRQAWAGRPRPDGFDPRPQYYGPRTVAGPSAVPIERDVDTPRSTCGPSGERTAQGIGAGWRPGREPCRSPPRRSPSTSGTLASGTDSARR